MADWIIWAVVTAALIALACWKFEKLTDWIADKFLPHLEDDQLQRAIDEWNERHKR